MTKIQSQIAEQTECQEKDEGQSERGERNERAFKRRLGSWLPECQHEHGDECPSSGISHAWVRQEQANQRVSGKLSTFGVLRDRAWKV